MTRDPHFGHVSSASIHPVRPLHDVGEQAEAIPLPGFRNVVSDTNGSAPARSPAQPTVSLVIPAKNEARNLATVLGHVPPRVGEVILVDGQFDRCHQAHGPSRAGPTSASSREDERARATPCGRVSRPRAATSSWPWTPTAAWPRSEIPNFVYFLEHGFDFVKGSRFVAGRRLARPHARATRRQPRPVGGGQHACIEPRFTDLCYGYFAFYRKYLDHLDLMSSGFEIETELTIRAVLAGLRIAEIPSMEMPRRSGQSSLRSFPDGARVLRTLMRERSSVAPHRDQRPPTPGSHDR